MECWRRRQPPVAEEPPSSWQCTPLRRCANLHTPRTRPQQCQRTLMPPSRRACSGPGTGTTNLLLREAWFHRIRPRQPEMPGGSSCERQNGRQGISLKYSDRAGPLSEHLRGAIPAFFLAPVWQASRPTPDTWNIQLNGQAGISPIPKGSADHEEAPGGSSLLFSIQVWVAFGAGRVWAAW